MVLAVMVMLVMLVAALVIRLKVMAGGAGKQYLVPFFVIVSFF